VILSQNYNTSVATATGGNADVAWQQGDMNDDGMVDFNDLVILSQNYNSVAAADTGTDTGSLTPVGSAAASSALMGSSAASAATSEMVAARQGVFSVKRVARKPHVVRMH